MSLFSKIFNQPEKEQVESFFKTFTAYRPTFTTWQGGLYESELVRSAINARATNISKLKVEFSGAAQPLLQTRMEKAPNEFQTWSQFLYRLSTILDIHNTAFIVPVFDDLGRVTGYYPVLPSRAEIINGPKGVPYLRYMFQTGDRAAIELSACGVMTKYQYRDDFFGERNERALAPTMQLVNIHNQGIEEAVNSSATFRFMAKLSNFSKAEDLAKEQKRFTRENLTKENGGMLLFPNTYTDIKQVQSSPYVVDAAQMELIRTNVFNYFGVNEDVLQNKAFGDAWSAFYEGAVEPFAIQFSDVVTKMTFTQREQSQGSCVTATSNRLQYMSNKDKLDVTAQMLDRGIFSINDVRDIWNLPRVENGDTRIIRGEYYSADQKVGESEEQNANS